MPKPKSNAGTEQLSALLYRLRAPKAAYDPLPTSITIAAARGDVQAATIFLEQGADIEERTVGFASPLAAACSQGRLEMAQFLHKRGARLFPEQANFTIIHFAAGHGFTEIVRWALDAGFPIDQAASALCSGAQMGRYETVKFLLERGVDPASPQAYGWGESRQTPAQLAQQAGFKALAPYRRRSKAELLQRLWLLPCHCGRELRCDL